MERPRLHGMEQDEGNQVHSKDQRGEFFESWENFLHKSNQNLEKEEDNEEIETKEKNPRQNRWDKIKRWLGQIISTMPSKEQKINDNTEHPIVEDIDLAEESGVSSVETTKAEDAQQEHSNAEIEQEENLPGESETRYTPVGLEHVGKIARRIENPAIAALSAAELTGRRQESKTKKELAKLKKAARTINKEQEELKNQQLAFEKQLDNKIRQTEKSNKQQAKINFAENHLPSRQKNNETILNKDELTEIINQNLSDSPEVVMERVEVAATQNLPIESLYERRHESKDASSDGSKDISGKSLAQASTLGGHINNKLPKTVEHSLDTSTPEPIQKQNPAKTQSTLYKQAVMGGFWTR